MNGTRFLFSCVVMSELPQGRTLLFMTLVSFPPPRFTELFTKNPDALLLSYKFHFGKNSPPKRGSYLKNTIILNVY